MIDIAYSITDNYADYCLVSIGSLLSIDHGQPVRIHILSDSFSEDLKSRFNDFVKSRNSEIQFHAISDNFTKDLKLGVWTKHAWYRICLPDILPDIQKILYVDVDIAFANSLKDLFEIDLDGYSMGACMDVKAMDSEVYNRLNLPSDYRYICSGVLMMNLDFMRQNNVKDRILDFAKNNITKLQSPDQDSINAVCHDSLLQLPLNYGIMDAFYRNDDFIKLYRKELVEASQNPIIIHYAGCPPWFAETISHPMEYYFWQSAKTNNINIKTKHWSHGINRMKLWVKHTLAKLGIQRYQGMKPIDLDKFIKANNY